MNNDMYDHLIGAELSSICFVRDYIEFHFDGPILRAISKPSCFVLGVSYRYPEIGSRDALCSLIGAEIKEVQIVQSQHIQCVFNNKSVLSISLTEPDPFSGESAHFIVGEHKPILIW